MIERFGGPDTPSDRELLDVGLRAHGTSLDWFPQDYETLSLLAREKPKLIESIENTLQDLEDKTLLYRLKALQGAARAEPLMAYAWFQAPDLAGQLEKARLNREGLAQLLQMAGPFSSRWTGNGPCTCFAPLRRLSTSVQMAHSVPLRAPSGL